MREYERKKQAEKERAQEREYEGETYDRPTAL